MTIAAVVITFNRLNLLKDVINALRRQTRKLDEIIVVNNGSSDGTSEWLTEQNDLFVITQSNTGSSGGQFTGFKAAFKKGYDYLWTMDDDVYPADDCLETLLKYNDDKTVVAPLRKYGESETFLNDAIKYNLKNPFRSFWVEVFGKEHVKNEVTSAVGITFEGPLIPRQVVGKVGFPETKFFIYGDDTEYFIRVDKAGYDIKLVHNARLYRQLPYAHPGKSVFSWKTYYVIRNLIAIDVLHGNMAVRLLRPIGYLLSWFRRCRSFKDLGITLKAFWNGYFYKSDN
jgi:GT2 family glycosyltransferase